MTEMATDDQLELGTEQPPPQTVRATRFVICERCGRPVRPEVRKCGWCGTSRQVATKRELTDCE